MTLRSLQSDERLRRLAVEHSVVDHCNLSCNQCDHGSPMLRKRLSSLKEFSRSVSRLAEILHVDTFKLVGGEPLLHPQIGDFARVAKESGIAREIQIWTNGTLIHRVPPIVFQHTDRLVITKYPTVELPIKEERLRTILSDLRCRLTIRRINNFIKCFPEEKHKDSDVIAETFKMCKNTGEWSCHSFQDGYYFKCSRAHYLRGRASGELTGENPYRDGISLDTPDLCTSLLAYLASEEPLAACAWCLGTSGEAFPHRMMSRKPS